MNVCEPSCPLSCRNGSGNISVCHHFGAVNSSTTFFAIPKPPSSLTILPPDLTNTELDICPCDIIKLILSPCHSARSLSLKAPFQLTSTGKDTPLLVLKKADSFQNGLLY